jgi:XTP/dITP diphosphohydrolase
MKIVAATKNEGKLMEFQRLLKSMPVEVLGLRDFGAVRLPPETGGTYLENAALKAEAAARELGLPSFGDDSGLEVDFLDGKPGIHSARFAGPDGNPEKNIARLLRLMKPAPPDRRAARFRAWLVLVYPDGAGGWRRASFEGVFEGSIAAKPAGRAGFGYDPVFLVPGRGRTVAQLSPGEKDAVSHRAAAARKMLAFIRENLLPPSRGT